MNTQIQQMELGFNARNNPRPVLRPQRRMAGASWWFMQMRAAVDRATDWRNAPPAPPVQEPLVLAAQGR
ncbi:MAG: hypothetical protein WCO56_26095 [Verrucomicrobiota bacterium]